MMQRLKFPLPMSRDRVHATASSPLGKIRVFRFAGMQGDTPSACAFACRTVQKSFLNWDVSSLWLPLKPVAC
ncbi:MAG TPA: hypothetical protein VL528_06670 [Oxalicibacterium sp.]|nr:hypothetical protein [Oxalicibacterium sp.]